MTTFNEERFSAFPFQRNYFPPPLTMLATLRRTEPLIRYQNDCIDPGVPKPIFRGKFVQVFSPPGFYKLCDGISDWYCEEVRITARHGTSKTPLELWNSSAFQEELRSNRVDIDNPESCRDFVFRNCQEAKQFMPLWVKGVVSVLYGGIIPPSLKFLDISAGWGDRLIAAISMGGSYLGFDPNSSLRSCYQRIIEELGDKQRHIVCILPFEDSRLEPESYDLCISSPPFYRHEIYTNEETQSVERYQDQEEWINSFLLVSLDKAWKAIKRGGFMAIHLADSKYMTACDRMVEFMWVYHRKTARYEGVIGIGSSTRIGVSVPVWVWKKL